MIWNGKNLRRNIIWNKGVRMSEQRFYITDTGLGLDTESDEMYSFGDEEDFCRLFDKLNEQQATISALKEENEHLRKELEKLKLLNESLGLFMNE